MHSGQRRSRRSRGYVTVQKPAVGFFIAGSSVAEMNGIFGRVRTEDVRSALNQRAAVLAYVQDTGDWILALVPLEDEEGDDDDDAFEWLFVD